MEYTQLLYHISKARAEKCAYVDAIEEVRGIVAPFLT